MTVQYGEDTSTPTTPGYGDLHPALQKHLDGINDHLATVTAPYGQQPFEQNPANNPMVQGLPNQTATASEGISTPSTPSTNPAQQAGQLPNDVAMQGATAGGSADSNQGAQPAHEVKPQNIQMPGSEVTAQPNVDTSDIDAIGKQANADQAALIQQHQAQQARMGNPGQGNANFQLGSNNNVPGFDGEQVNNARSIIQNGLARGMSRQDIETAIMTSLTESSLHNLNYGDRDSLGLFQQRASQGWGSPQQIMDPNYAIGKFYDTLAGANHSGMTPWQIAQEVQRSAYADGSNYQANYARAQQLVDALTQEQPQGKAAAPTMGANGSLNWISQHTDKYMDYDNWYGAQCVDLYDFYTTGFVGGQAIMVNNAEDIWYSHDANVYTQIDRAQIPHMGDVAVWGRGTYTPGSHVGIIIGDNGDGTVKTLSNNATSAGNKGNSAIVNISKAALLGYLRPNRLMGA